MKRYNNLIGTILALIPLNSTIISKIPIISTPLGIAVAWTDKAKAEDAQFYFDRAFNNENRQASIEEYSKLIDFYPTWEGLWRAYNNRGDHYLNLGDYESATNNFTKSLELNPYNQFSYASRGWIKHRIYKKYREAIFDYTNAIKIDPDYFQAYYHRGIAKWGLNDFYGAIEDHKKVIKLNPGNLDAYYWLSQAYQQDEVLKGDPISPYEKSVEYLDRVISAKASEKTLFDGNYDGWNYADAYFQRSMARFMLRDLYIQTLDAHDRQIEKKYNKIYDWSQGYGSRPIMVDFPFEKRVNAVTPLLEGSCSDMRRALTLGAKYKLFPKLITDAC